METRRGMLAGAAVALAATSLSGKAQARRGIDPRFQPVDDALAKFVGQGSLPCAAIQIAQRGEVLFQGFYSGRSTVAASSLYRVYSMTKPVTACAVAALCEDGKLTLETPVADLVPEFANLTVIKGSLQDVEPARPMTVAHLLTHASGIGSSWAGVTISPAYRKAGLEAGSWMFKPEIGGLAGFARRVASVPLQFQPGDGWLYGYSHDIAGLVIERASGETFGGYLKRRLFDPLGMSDTGFSVAKGQSGRLVDLYAKRAGVQIVAEPGVASAFLRPPAAESGSAGLVSSLTDYGRFAAMLAGGGALGPTRVLSPEWAGIMTSAYGPQDKVAASLGRFAAVGLGGSGAGLGQALGGVVALDDAAGPGSKGEYSWGGAASTTFWAAPGSGISAVVMTQLLPSGSVPLRDTLRPLVYAALAR